MQVDPQTLVPVQLEWDAWRLTEVPFRDLHDVHWFQPPGAPRALLHAFVSPARLLGTTLYSSAAEMSQRILVCILKSHTASATYAALVQRANEQTMADEAPCMAQ